MVDATKLFRGALSRIRGYHGSGQDFEKFDLGKAGTGEGTAAYGHGAYIAENPKTAQHYRDLAEAPALGTPEESAYNALKWAQGYRSSALQMLEYNASNGRDPFAAEAYQLLKSGWNPPKGKMYEVEVDADPDQLLNWEQRIDQHPQDVQDRLSQLAGNVNKLHVKHPDGNQARFTVLPGEEAGLEDLMKQWRDRGSDVTQVEEPLLRGDEVGASLYSRLSRSQPQASQKLLGVGVPGLRYLDQGSRRAGQGTSNYVIFDADLIKILRKYGLLPMASSLGMLPDGEEVEQ